MKMKNTIVISAILASAAALGTFIGSLRTK